MYTKYKTQKTWLKRNNSQSNLSKSASHAWFTKYRTTDKKKESSHYTYGMIVVFLTTQVSNNTFEDFFFNLKL